MEREGLRRRIVVAVDAGGESLYALSWCLKNVVAAAAAAPRPPPAEEGATSAAAAADEDCSGDTLVLVHARPPRVAYPAMDGTGYLFSSDITASMDRYNSIMSDSVMAKAKGLCADHPHVKVEVVVETGDARDVICEVVEKTGADLLVIGSHGYGLIQRTLIGSVSNHCAQHVKCPVLIVKKPKN